MQLSPFSVDHVEWGILAPRIRIIRPPAVARFGLSVVVLGDEQRGRPIIELLAPLGADLVPGQFWGADEAGEHRRRGLGHRQVARRRLGC